jgi:hypothetical protein
VTFHSLVEQDHGKEFSEVLGASTSIEIPLVPKNTNMVVSREKNAKEFLNLFHLKEKQGNVFSIEIGGNVILSFYLKNSSSNIHNADYCYEERANSTRKADRKFLLYLF